MLAKAGLGLAKAGSYVGWSQNVATAKQAGGLYMAGG